MPGRESDDCHALRKIHDGTCVISIIDTDMADVVLSTAGKLAPRSKCPHRAQGWRAGPGVEAEMSAAWQQREDARRSLCAEPHNSKGGRTFQVRKTAVLSFFRAFVRKIVIRIREGNQTGP